MSAATWMGRPIKELTREELIEVVLHMAHDLDSARENTEAILRLHHISREVRSRG